MSRRRPDRAGFTLVELMVALTLGALVIASVYTVGATSARQFQDQQRVSQLQLATRVALERVRRDASLAGFGGTPDSNGERSCGGSGSVPRFFGATVTDRDGDGEAVLTTMAGASDSLVQADRLQLVGNFDTGDVYLVRDVNGTSIRLQTRWQGFRRSFVDPSVGPLPDAALFDAVFAAGRVVRIVHPTAGTFFATIGTGGGVAGAEASVNISPALPSCFDVCLGCTIAPLSGVEYFLATAPPELQPTLSAAITGPNTVLMRGLFDPSTGNEIAGTARPVLEWAIHFDVDALVNINPATAPPNVVLQNDVTVNGGGALRASGIYALDVTIGGRTPEQDERFPWVAPAPGGPLNRFHANPSLPGAMRVRTAHAEILLPNIAYRGM